LQFPEYLSVEPISFDEIKPFGLASERRQNEETAARTLGPSWIFEVQVASFSNEREAPQAGSSRKGPGRTQLQTFPLFGYQQS